MNSDIYDELELTNDITFDQEIRIQNQTRAARTIQRWYKEKLEKRMMAEAEKAI
jgi:hypothetical protein